MKSLLILLFSIIWIANMQAQSTLSVSSASTAKSNLLSWDATSHNFGDIKPQQPQTIAFTFTNKTKQPVVITQAKGSCGCTVANYTQEPIAPGEVGTVKATYNAASLGAFSKTVAVKTTASREWQHLKITGIVIE
ncbi:MAG: DUF1573 domain-containing protein [Cyclobacteriaceae bacterium]